MDLETIFWLLLIAVPILRRLFGGKKPNRPSGAKTAPRPQPRPRPARTSPASDDGQTMKREKQLSPFQEALQQIQEALAEAREEQSRQVAEAEKARRKAREPQIEVREATFASDRSKPTKKKEKKAFFDSGSFEQVRAPGEVARAKVVAMPTVEKGNFYDDDFEANKPYEEEFHETVHSHVPASDDFEPRKKTKVDHKKWRQAYVMHEVLRSPRSKRPWTFHEPGRHD